MLAPSARSPAIHVFVWLVPKDVACARVDPARFQLKQTGNSAPKRNTPTLEEIHSVWQEIQSARSPIILVGPDIWTLGSNVEEGGEKVNVRAEIRRFCEATNIGVVMTPGGKGAVDPSAPYCLYTVSLIYRDYPNTAISQSDLVITLGYDRAEYDTSMWSGPAMASNIVHIGPSDAIIENLYNPRVRQSGGYIFLSTAGVCVHCTAIERCCVCTQLKIVADPGVVLRELNTYIACMREKGSAVPKWNIEAQVESRRRSQASFSRRTSEPTTNWLYQERIVADLQLCTNEFKRTTRSRHVTVVLDSGGAQVWTLRNWNCTKADELVSSNCFASMGIGLPSAIGVAYYYQQMKKPHRVLALLGDGGFVMNMQELETAARLNVSMVVVVWVNGSLGLVEWGDSTFVVFAHSSNQLPLRVSLTGFFCLLSLLTTFARRNVRHVKLFL